MQTSTPIIATWPVRQNDSFFDVLQKRGFNVLSMPLIDIRNLTFSLPRPIAEYHWIVFTSKNAIRAFLQNYNLGNSHKIAAIGKSTADVMSSFGVDPHFVGSGKSGKHFASELEAVIPDKSNVLVVLGNLAPDLIINYLATTRTVDRVDAYETAYPEHIDSGLQNRIINGDYALIAVSSPSIVRNLAQLVGDVKTPDLRVVSIGQTTTSAAREMNIEPVTTADHQSYEGLADTVLNYIEKTN